MKISTTHNESEGPSLNFKDSKIHFIDTDRNSNESIWKLIFPTILAYSRSGPVYILECNNESVEMVDLTSTLRYWRLLDWRIIRNMNFDDALVVISLNTMENIRILPRSRILSSFWSTSLCKMIVIGARGQVIKYDFKNH